MSYPKKHKICFVQMAEFDCPQVNYHEGRKWGYWWIEPVTKPTRLPIGEIPAALKGKKLNWIK